MVLDQSSIQDVGLLCRLNMLIRFHVQILCWEEVMFNGSKALEESESRSLCLSLATALRVIEG
jgi:hypothetical protein